MAMLSNDALLKSHPQYRHAKGGDQVAAGILLADLARDFMLEASRRFGPDCIFVAPHAHEAQGDNAIPQMLASALAIFSNGSVDYEIVQATKVFHTGADRMERLNARPRFSGKVRADGHYVLVDDVTTMGGTLAELAHYIQAKGGVIRDILVLANASRARVLHPQKQTVAKLERRFGHEIAEIFGIEPAALTADEANYLIGFRTTDEIRNRKAAAAEETNRRLRSKGILPLGQPEGLAAQDRRFAAHFRRALWRAQFAKRLRRR